MQRLGYTRYVAQGGDWGAVVTEAMGRQAPRGLAGIHVNYPATVPPEVEAALAVGGPAPAELSEQERAVFDALESSAKKGGRAYFGMMTAAAGPRIRPGGLPGRPRRVAARVRRLRTVDLRRRPPAVPDER
jgi:pimeloyl-ACP methyl ester carboxylesterase